MDNKDTQIKRWYPLYTKPRHEKKAYSNIVSEGYEAYLPIVKTTKFWKDRKKIVDEPLIKSYVFVNILKHQLYNIVQINGVSRYIKFNNGPACVRNEEIDAMKKIIDADVQIEVSDNLIAPGQKIKMLSGPMAGYEGEIVEEKGKNKLVVRLESIGKALKIVIGRENINIKK